MNVLCVLSWPEGVEVAVARADVERAVIGECWRRVDEVACCELPDRRPSIGREGDNRLTHADVDHAVGTDGRRRRERVGSKLRPQNLGLRLAIDQLFLEGIESP